MTQEPGKPQTPQEEAAGGAVVLRVFLAIFGLVALLGFAADMRRGIVSQSWAATGGQVLSSTIDRDEDGYYGAMLTYRYEIDGVSYTGHDVHASEMHFGDGKEHAEETVRRYPAGTYVTVHYDSKHPSAALLEPGANSGDFGTLLIAAFVLFLAIWGKPASQSS